MSFWSSEKLKRISSEFKLVEPFDEGAIKCGAYELSLGPEAYLTSDDSGKKIEINIGEQIVLPPGQFGLLLTEEKVTVPNNTIGFISIKAGIKFRGLVNVSGFHVDPGFCGRLKFSVYNAGSQNIVLQRNQKVFLIWYSDLDAATKPYSGDHANQNDISSDDVMRIQGEIASPGQLKKELKELEHKFATETQKLEGKLDNLKVVLAVFLTIASSLLVRNFSLSTDSKDTPKQTISQTVMTNAPTTVKGATPAK